MNEIVHKYHNDYKLTSSKNNMKAIVKIKLKTDGVIIEEWKSGKDWSLDWGFTFEYGENGDECHVHIHNGSKFSDIIFNPESVSNIIKESILFLLSDLSEQTIGSFPESWKRGHIYNTILNEEDEWSCDLCLG